MNYRSLQNLNHALLRRIDDLPSDLRLVVGVPRSGLLAANLLALHLNLPLTDVDGLLAGRAFKGGERSRLLNLSNQAGSILVLDDSVCTGKALAQVRQQLRAFSSHHQLIFAAVFATPENTTLVDFHFDTVALPRAFEWNLLHSSQLCHACVDIDGVLCRDPSPAENDDGPRYAAFLESVEPRLQPVYEIATLVTSRLEKYREPTQRWLARHGFGYRRLLMLDLPSATDRRRLQAAAPFKAQVYRQTDASLFIESDPHQAMAIARQAVKPVYCSDTRAMIHPAGLPAARSAIRRWAGDQHWRARLAMQRLLSPHADRRYLRGTG